MKPNEIIDLENNTSYLLLLNSEIDNESYFLAVRLEKDDTPTQDYIILKEMNENNESYIQKVNDPFILSKLITEYYLDLEEDFT